MTPESVVGGTTPSTESSEGGKKTQQGVVYKSFSTTILLKVLYSDLLFLYVVQTGEQGAPVFPRTEVPRTASSLL